LIKEYLLDNPHRLTFTLTPEPTLAATLAADEAAVLSSAADALQPDELAALAAETAQLKAAQAAHDPPEALAKLPVLTTADLDPNSKPLPIAIEALDDEATLLTHELPTDGIVYLDVALDLRRLALEDVPYLPLFTRMLSELGTTSCGEVAFSRRIGSLTGGLRTSYLSARKPVGSGGTAAAVASADEAVAYLLLRGKSVAAKSESLFELAAEMLTSTDLDQPSRAIEMLREAKVRIEASAVSSGNGYAASSIAAKYSLAAHVDDLLGGFPQLQTVKEALA